MCRASILVQYHDVSVVIPFRDDEEVIGNLVNNIARHLRERGHSFEIIAVDDDSRDNSFALLALIRAECPELRLATADRDHGHVVGARQARGRILWFVEPGTVSFSSLTDAYHRVDTGEVDVVLEDEITLARRARVTPLLDDLRGRGARFRQQLAARAERSRLLTRKSTRRRMALRRPTRPIQQWQQWMSHLASVLRQPHRHAG